MILMEFLLNNVKKKYLDKLYCTLIVIFQKLMKNLNKKYLLIILIQLILVIY